MPGGTSNIQGVNFPGSSGTCGTQNTSYLTDYRGFTARETSGTNPCAFRIRANGSATGVILDEVSLAPGQSISAEMDPGRECRVGFYIELVSGTMPSGAVYFT